MKVLCGCITLLWAVLNSLGAELVTLIPAADTSIISEGVNPRGNDTILSGTRNNTVKDRGLLRFDLSSVPQTATITSARLILRVEMIPRVPVNADFGLYRALQGWDDTATWTSPKAGSGWGFPGGQAAVDYGSTISAATLIEGLGTYEFASDGLVADIKGWVTDPASNFGWFLICANEAANNTARHFSSRESGQPPQLIIEFSTGERLELTDVALKEGKLSFRLDPGGKPFHVEWSLTAAAGSWGSVADAIISTLPKGVEVMVPATGAHLFFRAVLD